MGRHTNVIPFSVRVKQDFKKNKGIYFIAILPIIYYILFHYLPMYGALIAFKNYKPNLGVFGSDWVGMKHFKMFFESPNFLTLMKNTLRISISSIVVTFPAPIILAILLNELKCARYSKLVQNVMYMPHFISAVVVYGMVRMFTMDTGFIGAFVGNLFEGKALSLLNYAKYFVPVYVGTQVWQGVGWGSIIYLAALTGIDEQLYEAAKVDGAGKFKQLIHITLPGIFPTIIVMLILKMGSVLSVGFEGIILLYNDATMPVADVISSYVYRKGLIDLSWSFSSAVGLFNSVINFLLVITTNYISKKVNGYGLW